MTFRKLISLSIAVSFVVLFVTGVLSFFQPYSNHTATLHTVFGVLFTFGVVFHLKNNFRSIILYLKGKLPLFIVLIGVLVFFAGYYQMYPLNKFMDFGAKQKATSEKELNRTVFELVEMNTLKDIQLSIDVLRSEHYWHPQMAIWIEDTEGNYKETLFVSKATAKGLFFGGRSKENFKDFDEIKNASGDYRRVNALPVWSDKRGVKYADGLFVPPSNQPLPDAITGATITDNFQLITSIDKLKEFTLKIEINVAFDDNEYYSAYDFPDDEVFHNGTGQLGQPSIIFEAKVNMNDDKNYYLMDLVGHGHHSGQNGIIYKDLSGLTTAKKIIERIVLGVQENL